MTGREAFGPLLAEGASLDLVASNASLNQGVTNGVDIGFTNLNFLIILFLLLKFLLITF